MVDPNAPAEPVMLQREQVTSLSPASLTPLSIEPLREEMPKHRGTQEACWRRDAFAPFTCWDEVTMLRRTVAELQDRMSILIERINGCQGCNEGNAEKIETTVFPPKGSIYPKGE